jgi:hypothetical protein
VCWALKRGGLGRCGWTAREAAAADSNGDSNSGGHNQRERPATAQNARTSRAKSGMCGLKSRRPVLVLSSNASSNTAAQRRIAMDRSTGERRASREEPDPPGRLRTRPSPPLNPQVLPYPGCTSPDGLRSGDGPLSVRVRPSSLKRDCDRGTTSTGGKYLVNVHAKSRLTPEPLRTLRSEDKARPEPARTRRGPSPARRGRSRHSSRVQQRFPDSSKHELSPTSSVSWDSGQPPSTAASAVTSNLRPLCLDVRPGQRAPRSRQSGVPGLVRRRQRERTRRRFLGSGRECRAPVVELFVHGRVRDLNDIGTVPLHRVDVALLSLLDA